MHTSYGEPVLIDALLTAGESEGIIKDARTQGFIDPSSAYPPNYRDNERLVLDDPERARWLFERLAPRLPPTLTDEEGAIWELSSLNSRFRYCRYSSGQKFSVHRDGAHFESVNRRSFLTAMIYLNSASEFVGGATRFYRGRETSNGITLEVHPERGAAVIFSHALWHDGQVVTGGCKYIMRTDVMYQRRIPTRSRAHDGYVWSLAALGHGQIASGGRDKTVRIWEGSDCVEVLHGHQLSVTAAGSDGSRSLWTGSRDGNLRLWNRGAHGWNQGRSLQAHEGALISMTNACRGCFATGGADASVAIWTEDGTLQSRRRTHSSWVWGLAWDLAGGLYSGSEDGTIAGPDRQVGTGHPVRALVFTGSHLVSGDDRGIVSAWDSGLHEVQSFAAHAGAITSLVSLPGSLIASASEDDTVRLWDMRSGRCLRTWPHEDFVRCLVQQSDGQLVSGGYDGRIRRLSWARPLASSKWQESKEAKH